jgi:multidrug efflux pump subunit AcrA (membrane-fusion protein)
MSPSSPPAMSVTGARAEVAPMKSEIQLLGTTVALRHLTMRAPSAGRVVAFDVQSGDHVHRGEIVAHIVSREVEAAENGLAVAQRIDPREAPTLAEAVKRYNRGEGIAVAAPADAIVTQRIVSSGQMVADLDPLADLIDPSSICVEATVPIDDIWLVRPGMEANVSSPITGDAELPARVAALSPNFSPNGATTPARIEFSGTARIDQAGAPVEVSVTTREVPNTLVIPEEALFENAARNTSYVFISDASGRARRTTVDIGMRSSNRAQVLSGLRRGQIVLTSGGYALSDGLKVNVTVSGY